MRRVLIFIFSFFALSAQLQCCDITEQEIERVGICINKIHDQIESPTNTYIKVPSPPQWLLNITAPLHSESMNLNALYFAIEIAQNLYTYLSSDLPLFDNEILNLHKLASLLNSLKAEQTKESPVNSVLSHLPENEIYTGYFIYFTDTLLNNPTAQAVSCVCTEVHDKKILLRLELITLQNYIDTLHAKSDILRSRIIINCTYELFTMLTEKRNAGEEFFKELPSDDYKIIAILSMLRLPTS